MKALVRRNNASKENRTIYVLARLHLHPWYISIVIIVAFDRYDRVIVRNVTGRANTRVLFLQFSEHLRHTSLIVNSPHQTRVIGS